ncbi:MAG TPA: AAA family ATPase [Flavilitoribacter sp.]|nr:AAA family ATPase [Flavilitoribacter sp.]HMQ87608.1 AAA family ATPase [Flavilitoribacter sp.]
MIERIIIENYKSIRRLDLPLQPINILIGANGAGKSNFISFFQLVNRLYEGTGREYTEEKGANSLLYRGVKHSNYLKGLLDFNNVNAYEFSLAARNDESMYLRNQYDYYNHANDHSKNYTTWNRKTTDSPYRDGVTYRNQYIKIHLSSFRVYHFHDTSDQSAMKRINQVDDNRYLKEDASNLASFLYLLQERFPKHFRQIEMTVQSIAPFFEKFDLRPRALQPDQIKLEWKEKGSDMYLDAHNLSDGTLRFIALTTLLMQPEPPETIIIDEPELGLHPVAINKLAGLLYKASHQCQVIVGTQSVGLVNNFSPDCIITVDRKDEQSVFERLHEEKLHNWLEDFSLGELWNKKVIGGQP